VRTTAAAATTLVAARTETPTAMAISLVIKRGPSAATRTAVGTPAPVVTPAFVLKIPPRWCLVAASLAVGLAAEMAIITIVSLDNGSSREMGSPSNIWPRPAFPERIRLVVDIVLHQVRTVLRGRNFGLVREHVAFSILRIAKKLPAQSTSSTRTFHVIEVGEASLLHLGSSARCSIDAAAFKFDEVHHAVVQKPQFVIALNVLTRELKRGFPLSRRKPLTPEVAQSTTGMHLLAIVERLAAVKAEAVHFPHVHDEPVEPVSYISESLVRIAQ
jgi:hypothetical protein